MPGPMSAGAGATTHPRGSKRPHDKCQERERCTGPGCRVRTGKTAISRTGEATAKVRAEHMALMNAANDEQED